MVVGIFGRANLFELGQGGLVLLVALLKVIDFGSRTLSLERNTAGGAVQGHMVCRNVRI